MLTATLLAVAASAPFAQPLYPEGVATPRYATAEELLWAATHTVAMPKGAATAPTGPVTSPGEYEQSEGIIMAWEGGNTLNNIQRQMIQAHHHHRQREGVRGLRTTRPNATT